MGVWVNLNQIGIANRLKKVFKKSVHTRQKRKTNNQEVHFKSADIRLAGINSNRSSRTKYTHGFLWNGKSGDPNNKCSQSCKNVLWPWHSRKRWSELITKVWWWDITTWRLGVSKPIFDKPRLLRESCETNLKRTPKHSLLSRILI